MHFSFPFHVSKATRYSLIALLTGLVGITSLSAQDQSARNPDETRQRRGQGGGGGGERRNFDPSVMRDRMAGFMRNILEVEDNEEWAIIGERIQKVSQLRSSTTENPQFALRILATLSANRARGEGEEENENRGERSERPERAERPERGNGGNQRGQTRQPGGDGNSAMGGLVNALRNEASEAEVMSQLETFRATKQKNADQLSQAQEDLLMVLTSRQEAILVLAGMLP